MSRETKDRLYQVIQYGKEKGPPVRWAGTEGSNGMKQDQTCHGKTIFLFSVLPGFSTGQTLVFLWEPRVVGSIFNLGIVNWLLLGPSLTWLGSELSITETYSAPTATALPSSIILDHKEIMNPVSMECKITESRNRQMMLTMYRSSV